MFTSNQSPIKFKAHPETLLLITQINNTFSFLLFTLLTANQCLAGKKYYFFSQLQRGDHWKPGKKVTFFPATFFPTQTLMFRNVL